MCNHASLEILKSWDVETLKMLKCCVELHLNLNMNTTFQDLNLSKGQHFNIFNISRFQNFKITNITNNYFKITNMFEQIILFETLISEIDNLGFRPNMFCFQHFERRTVTVLRQAFSDNIRKYRLRDHQCGCRGGNRCEKGDSDIWQKRPLISR